MRDRCSVNILDFCSGERSITTSLQVLLGDAEQPELLPWTLMSLFAFAVIGQCAVRRERYVSRAIELIKRYIVSFTKLDIVVATAVISWSRT